MPSQTLDLVQIKNEPDLSHVKRQDRERAMLCFRMQESVQQDTPEAVLHYTLTGRVPQLPRQLVAYLLQRYCVKHRIQHTHFLEALKQHAGDQVLSIKGLVGKRDKQGCRKPFNLLRLSDDVLWNMYLAVPIELRPPERPKKEPTAPVEKKIKKPRASRKACAGMRAPRTSTGKFKIARGNDGELHVQMEQAMWACCDKCNKWRRLYNTTEDELSAKWQCSDHPDGLTCNDPEDAMDLDEQWDGAVAEVSHAEGSDDVDSPSERSSLPSPAYTAPVAPLATRPATPAPEASQPAQPVVRKHVQLGFFDEEDDD